MSTKPYLHHISKSDDLVTTYEAIRAGFVQLALERNRRATPSVDEARTLKAAASKASDPSELLKISGIRSALLTAAGLSVKAMGHLEETDKNDAINGLVKKYLEPAGKDFVEELVFRFLLTKGDALGGSMRNIGGAMAQYKLTRLMISTLCIAGTDCQWLHSGSGKWIALQKNNSGIEQDTNGLSWASNGKNRTLLFNRKVPFVGNNVDLILIDRRPQDVTKETIADPSRYICFGELKGGIDPAGADEHWKTARTSLSRIREAYTRLKVSTPPIFFVGSAIEKKMADEIWNWLKNDQLTNAANMTNDSQAASICRWLCSL